MKIFLIVLVIVAGLFALNSFFSSERTVANDPVADSHANDPVTDSQRQASLDDWTQVLRQSDLGDGKRARLADRLKNESLVCKPIKIGIEPVRGPIVDTESPIRVVLLLPKDSKISKFWGDRVNAGSAVYDPALDALLLSQIPSDKELASTAIAKALEAQMAQ